MGLKLTRQVQIFILIGLLLAGALVLSANGTLASAGGSLFEFGLQERNELNTKLTSTQERLKSVKLEPLTARKTQLEQQLAQSADQLEQVREILAHPINKTEIIGVLFTTTKAHNLEITKMSLTALSDDLLVEVPVTSVKLAITVQGDVVKLVAFISDLNTLYTYGVVESASIKNTEVKTGQKADADLILTLYTVQGR